MRTKIIVVGLVAAVIYFRGARSHRPVKGKQPETLRHQVERLWNDPKAAKSRKKLAKKVADSAADRLKQARKAV
ncbi:hypothetical protein AS850_15495 [Frondihabitans sp. 762G35]|uniref:hypothetical protein n=1 Tax=Frondihabitans sp. 762G35 TaxID=1446794 RepID=UPI000D20D421|nr:hypothetical protein [Frondihabitans sp. 762G35]ARC58491.1 hypothetical protein AS850_15495 [Frondihabitans sp. 762G35]